MNLTKALGSVGGLTLVSRVLGVRPRHAVRALRRRGLRVRRVPDRLPPAQHVPRAVRGGRLLRRLHPDVQPQGRATADGNGLPAGLAFAEDALSVLLPVLLVMTASWSRRLAGHLGAVGRLQRRHAATVRLRRVASRVSPSPICCSSAWSRCSAASSIRCTASGSTPPRRSCSTSTLIAALLFFHGHEPLRDRAQSGDRRHRLGRAATALAVLRLPPRRRDAAAQAAAAQRRT